MGRRHVLVLSALAILAACGDNGTSPQDEANQLSVAELNALFAELGAALSNIGFGGLGASGVAGPMAVSVPIDLPVSETVPCDSGSQTFAGTIAGDADVMTGGFDVVMNLVWTHNACVLRSATSPTVFTLNSTPSVRYVVNLVSDPPSQTITASGTQVGAIRIQTSDGRSVSCLIDVEYDTVSTAGSVTQSVTGMVCGVDVSVISTFPVVSGA